MPEIFSAFTQQAPSPPRSSFAPAVGSTALAVGHDAQALA